MKDIVLIPCYQRAEFLHITLELIQKAEGAEDLKYLFVLDYGFNKEVLRVIEDFPFEKEIFKTPNYRLGIGKQSFNVLNGMKLAAEQTREFVFNIEEDIFISNDFFKWHYAVQRQHVKGMFCSIGTANHNSDFKTKDDLEAYYLSNPYDYQSLGVCFDKEVIKSYIYPHINMEYFTQPSMYCNRMDTQIRNQFCEQDGLIRRIMARSGMVNAFPHVPRAYHAGFYGKNRNVNFSQGSLENRIKALRQICFNPTNMRAMCRDLWKDSIPANLEPSTWESQYYLQA